MRNHKLDHGLPGVSVGPDPADILVNPDLVAFADADAAEILVNRKKVTMLDHHGLIDRREYNDARDFASKDRTGIRATFGRDLDAAVMYNQRSVHGMRLVAVT